MQPLGGRQGVSCAPISRGHGIHRDRQPPSDTASIFFVFPRGSVERCFEFVGRGERETAPRRLTRADTAEALRTVRRGVMWGNLDRSGLTCYRGCEEEAPRTRRGAAKRDS